MRSSGGVLCLRWCHLLDFSYDLFFGVFSHTVVSPIGA